MHDKLRTVSDRIESTGSMGDDDGKVVSELVDKSLVAIVDRKVSSKVARINELVADGSSLLPPYPRYLVNHLPQHPGSVSDVMS